MSEQVTDNTKESLKWLIKLKVKPEVKKSLDFKKVLSAVIHADKINDTVVPLPKEQPR